MGKQLDMEARAAIEGLRSGAVSRSIVRRVTYGRDTELSQLRSTIEKQRHGSTQVLIGGYGVGKSHLCEVLALQLEDAGYAVARLELGASDGRAENPHAVVRSIERMISVHVDGRRFQGREDLSNLIRAIRLPRRPYLLEHQYLQLVHKQLPGRDKVLARVDRIRDGLPAMWADAGRTVVPDPSVARTVPRAMTAANLAVAAVNGIAHDLAKVGVPGLVVIFDEAERSEWASNGYRVERARDLMVGFATAAANRDTSGLKHHRNEAWYPYVPEGPSRIHALFAFTYRWGLAAEIGRCGDTTPIELRAFSEKDRARIESHVTGLYESAYGRRPRLTAVERNLIDRHTADEDIRMYIRSLVAALDQTRLRG